MYQTPKTKRQLRLVNMSFVLLFLAAIGLMQWLAREYPWRVDLTQNARHTLSPASLAVLERLPNAISVTAFASTKGELRRQIREQIERYRRHKPDMTLDFVDPDTAPERVRAEGVLYDGTVVLRYGEAKETLAPGSLNEEAITNALTRLGHRGERWFVFLAGHGERSPERKANFDYSVWADELRKRGFKTRTQTLAELPKIPDNISALVIAGPRVKLLPGEVREILSYIERGGNLLWLHDPGPLQGLAPIAEYMGLEFLNGVVVDPASQAITGNTTAIVVGRYGSHPVVRYFEDVTLFPHSGAISVKAPKDWRATPLIDTRPEAWLETAALTPGTTAKFDKGTDIAGPLTLGTALVRELPEKAAAEHKREQRIVAIADGDFLSNTYLANGGNLELGLSVANWLSQNDAYVSMPVGTVRDRQLNLGLGAQTLLAIVFLALLPILLGGAGVAIWWRRRKL